jgi:hypothetical protein
VGVRVRPDARKPGRWYVRINHRGRRKSVAFKNEKDAMRAAVAIERELQHREMGSAFSELGGIEARLEREIPLGFRTEHAYVQQTIAALLRAAGWQVTIEARVPGLGIADIRAGYQGRITALIEIGNLSVNESVPTRGQRLAAMHRQADLVLHLPYEHPLFEMLCLPVRLKNAQQSRVVDET